MKGHPFDLIVIGSGPAGTAAVESAHELGAKRIAIVESAQRLGGECPNTGCVPTKALLRSIEVLLLARRAKEFGIVIPSVKPDYKAMMKRKDDIVDMATWGGRMERIYEKLGALLIRGPAVFTNKNTIEVRGMKYESKAFIVATGAENYIPPIEGLGDAGFYTFEDLVDLPQVPASMVIVGGGPIACEWAQILGPLGCKIIIVEFLDHILPREEEEMAEVLRQSFMRQGIETLTAHETTKVAKKGGFYEVTVKPRNGGKAMRLKCHALMIATGQRPSVSGLGLEHAGVAMDEKGRPKLNEYLQTSNKGLYFAGDVTATMMFTHTAHEQGNISAYNAVRGNKKKMDLRVVPRVTFVFPEVGSVGMTEKEAREKGYDVAIGRTSFSSISKPFLTGERDGVVKIVIDKKTRKILGGHIVGHAAAEMIHEIALAMYANLSYTKLATMIHAYPTLSEAIGVAAYEVDKD